MYKPEYPCLHNLHAKYHFFVFLPDFPEFAVLFFEMRSESNTLIFLNYIQTHREEMPNQHFILMDVHFWNPE